MADEANTNESRRGKVEASVKALTDLYVGGNLPAAVEINGDLTPYKAAVAIKKLEALDNLPSSGSITEVFKRWKDIGFARFGDKPFAFKDYTSKGRELGLTALKERHTVKLRKEREAAKAAEGGAATPAVKKAAPKKAAAPAKKAAAPKPAASKPAAPKPAGVGG